VQQIGTYSKLEKLIVNGLPCNMAESVAASRQPSDNDVFMPYKSSSTTESTFISFHTANLWLDIRPNDISIWNRLKKTEKMLNSTIIVRLTNSKARELVLTARKNLKSSSDPYLVGLYIKEHLTRNTSKIYAIARRLVKEKRQLQSWSATDELSLSLLIIV
jgi:hypothetical protein